MDKNEVKTLLKRRDSLLGLCKDLSIDSNDESNTVTVNGIYRNTHIAMSKAVSDIDKQLLRYCKDSPVGGWLLQIKGITPDIAAGLLAYFDIRNKTCAAQFIRYSGVDNFKDPHNNNVRQLMERLKNNFKSNPESLYGKLNKDKFDELINGDDEISQETAHIRADRYMRKIFISHLFEEMYREEHNGSLPDRYNDNDRVIIEPEVPYTRDNKEDKNMAKETYNEKMYNLYARMMNPNKKYKCCLCGKEMTKQELVEHECTHMKEMEEAHNTFSDSSIQKIISLSEDEEYELIKGVMNALKN